MHRPSAALVLGAVAVFIALGGSAAAATGMLSGSQIKKNSIPLNRLTGDARASRGERGPRGYKGATGDRGQRGKTSARGATGLTGSQGPQGAVGATGSAGPAGPAGAPGAPGNGGALSVVYSDIPSPFPDSLPAEGFQAAAAAEFGGAVQLAGSARNNPVVSVLLDSFGCESGTGTSCVTTPGSAFSLPITLNIHALNADGSVGALVVSYTNTFEIPYRPSSDSTCTGGQAGYYVGSDGACHASITDDITFDLGGQRVTLPNDAVVSVALNTTSAGYQPQGTQFPCHATTEGCGYDNLNMSFVPSTTAPSVGSQPQASTMYENTASRAANANGTLNVFGPDANDTATWGVGGGGYYQPAIEVSATN
jgi:Collagen triple helix repeat (20 copies)